MQKILRTPLFWLFMKLHRPVLGIVVLMPLCLNAMHLSISLTRATTIVSINGQLASTCINNYFNEKENGQTAGDIIYKVVLSENISLRCLLERHTREYLKKLFSSKNMTDTIKQFIQHDEFDTPTTKTILNTLGQDHPELVEDLHEVSCILFDGISARKHATKEALSPQLPNTLVALITNYMCQS